MEHYRMRIPLKNKNITAKMQLLTMLSSLTSISTASHWG